MNAQNKNKPESRIADTVAVGKDFVSLLRDAALFGLAILLVAFPNQFNDMLVAAGFEEGSLVGFKWKSKLIDSNEALQKAEATIESLRVQNAELANALEEVSQSSDDPVLAKRLEQLETDNKNLNDETMLVQSAVTQAIDSNIPLVTKALSSARRDFTQAKSDYLVGLQTLGVPDSERIAINDKLSADGYGLDNVTYSYPAGERPSWFAYKSTVFYYSSSSRQAAQELAEFMKSITGQKFAVQRGAGLGVDPDKKAITFFIHYIKNSN